MDVPDLSKRLPSGWRGSRGVALVAVAVFLVVMIAVSAGSSWMRAYFADRARVGVERELTPYAAALNNAVNSKLALVVGLDQFIVSQLPDGPTQKSFDTYAAGLYEFTTGVRAVEAAPGGVIRYIYPLAGNEAAMGLDLLHDSRPTVVADAQRALMSSATVVGGPYDLTQGGTGIITRSAIRSPDGAVWGLSTLVIDVPSIMKQAQLDKYTAGLSIAVRNAAGEGIWGDQAVFDANPVLLKIPLPEGEWDMAAIPLVGWSDAGSTGQPLLWGFGLLGALALALLGYLAISYQLRLRMAVDERTREIGAMNEILRADVRAMSEAEETLRSSERRFRLLFDASPLPMAIVVADHISLVNQAFLDVYAIPSTADVVDRHIMEFFTPESAQIVAAYVRRRAEGDSSGQRYEIDALTPDGGSVPIELNVVEFVHDGVATKLAIVVDMRPKRAAEKALRESEVTYRMLFEDSPVALSEEDFSRAKAYLEGLEVSTDQLESYLSEHPECVSEGTARMRIQRANGAIVKLMGAQTQEEVLNIVGSFVTDETRELYAAELCAIARGQESFSGDTCITTPDGRRLHVALSWTVPPGGAVTYERVFVSLIDMTQEYELRASLEEYRDNLRMLVNQRTEELTAANIELVKATRAKDEFLAAMSHELRTPLNSVIGFSGIMLQGLAGELNDEQRHQLNMIKRSGRHLLGLINQVLDLSRIAAGQTGLSAFDFEVAGLARSLHDELAHAAEAKGIELRCSSELSDPLMHSDPQKISQILLNLLSNAIKFTEQGEVFLRIWDVDDDVFFQVSDTGPGIPSEEREHVFEAFYQLGTEATAKPEGTGLGLAISRDLAVLLGGTLEFVDSPAGGACAVMSLPRLMPEPSPAE